MKSVPTKLSHRPSVTMTSPPSRSETPELLRGVPSLTASPQFWYIPGTVELATVIVRVAPFAAVTGCVPLRFELAGAPITVTEDGVEARADPVVTVAVLPETTMDTRLPSFILHLGRPTVWAKST